jgi:hypothetical protein
MLTGWDATVLKNWQLQEGIGIDRVVAELGAALGAFNGEIANDPLWAGLVSYQDAPEVEYNVGSTTGVRVHTEYGRSDAQRSATDGHLLPLLPYDRMMGWTWDYLRMARMSQLQADIRGAIQDWRDKWRVASLTRCLQRGDDSGAAKGLGSSGYSPGFATTAASTSVDFVPPAYGGSAFANTHEHYVGITGSAFTLALFQDAKAELREHGHEPPYDFLIGVSDEATVRGLTGFVQVASANVRYGNAVDLVTLPAATGTPNGIYPIGLLEDFVVHVVTGMPQYYGFGYKSYGPNSQRNPLRIRLQKGETAFRVIAMPDPRNGNGAHPLQSVMLFGEFGVGVSDRTAGTPRYTASATWVDGTPT